MRQLDPSRGPLLWFPLTKVQCHFTSVRCKRDQYKDEPLSMTIKRVPLLPNVRFVPRGGNAKGSLADFAT